MTPSFRLGASFCVATLLVACGGGGADGTGSTALNGPGAAVASYSSGVMTKGSVILNGVRYDDSAARIDDDRGRSAAQLASGMRVTLRGRIGDDGTSGSAERVKVVSELRGTVTAVDTASLPQSFTVSGVRVRVDDATLWSTGTALATLVGQRVEVHGLRDATGTIRATRVEGGLPSTVADELRGAVVSVSGGGFTLSGGASGPVTVVAGASASFEPAACTLASLAAGRVVEVHGAFTGDNAFTASRIECEDLDDDSKGLRPPSGARIEIEGYVSGLDLATSSFVVDGRRVTWSAATEFDGGVPAGLVNGVRVEVEGSLDGSTLVAREISFEESRVLLRGAVQSTGASTFTVLGRTVQYNGLTSFEVSGGLAVGRPVQVSGTLGASDTLVAEEVRDASGGREIVRAPVSAKTATSVTLLGLTVALPSNALYRNADGTAFPSLQAFLSAITASPTGGTVVTLRGSPLAGGLEQGEIER